MTDLQTSIAQYMRTHSVPTRTTIHHSNDRVLLAAEFGTRTTSHHSNDAGSRYAGLQQCMRNVTRSNTSKKLRYCISR